MGRQAVDARLVWGGRRAGGAAPFARLLARGRRRHPPVPRVVCGRARVGAVAHLLWLFAVQLLRDVRVRRVVVGRGRRREVVGMRIGMGVVRVGDVKGDHRLDLL